jgi:hypothetical protein
MGVISVGIEIPTRVGEIEVVNVITATEAIAKLAHAACETIVIGPVRVAHICRDELRAGH